MIRRALNIVPAAIVVIALAPILLPFEWLTRGRVVRWRLLLLQVKLWRARIIG